jgi:hypothetical protein
MNARCLIAGLSWVLVAIAVPAASPLLARQPEKNDEAAEIKKLGEARVAAAKKAYAVAAESVKSGIPGVKAEDLYRWSVRWLNAQRDATGKLEIRLSALNDHLKRMQELSRVAAVLTKAGQGSALDGAAAEFYLREAELWVAQAKTTAKRTAK